MGCTKLSQYPHGSQELLHFLGQTEQTGELKRQTGDVAQNSQCNLSHLCHLQWDNWLWPDRWVSRVLLCSSFLVISSQPSPAFPHCPSLSCCLAGAISVCLHIFLPPFFFLFSSWLTFPPCRFYNLIFRSVTPFPPACHRQMWFEDRGVSEPHSHGECGVPSSFPHCSPIQGIQAQDKGSVPCYKLN